jgi:hypothetical protein
MPKPMTGATVTTAATATLALLLAAGAHAHHSPVAFDTPVTDFSITGEIEHVNVRNPHSVMSARVTNDDGSHAVWDIEFSSVNLLLRRGRDFERLIAAWRGGRDPIEDDPGRYCQAPGMPSQALGGASYPWRSS